MEINSLTYYFKDKNMEYIKEKVEEILQKDYQKNFTTENLKKVFSFIDLTSLNSIDTDTAIKAMVEKVNDFGDEYPEMPHVAAICIYPGFVETIKQNLKVEGVEIASVGASFPSSQTFISVKLAECELIKNSGAHEIDIVIPLAHFLENEYKKVFNEIFLLKETIKPLKLKVILETGALPTPGHIELASIIAMEAGADFVKTSTGKLQPAASLEAIYIMAQTVKAFYKKHGIMIGIKPAGGISTPEEAIKYYTLIHSILGPEWIDPKYFRIGASRLANNLLTAIYGEKKNWF